MSEASDLVVIKFGGTSLGTAARMRRAALRVRGLQRRGRTVVVVVSAAGTTTDRLVARVAAAGGGRATRRPGAPLSCGVAPGHDGRERDRALATGEELAAALLAQALLGCGVPARSMRGGEAGLRAQGEHGAGALTRLRRGPLRTAIAAGVVPVVAGFQAIDEAGETLTLGRGASDLTAVFIAAALRAVECHIVTDVAGVYDRDPRHAPGAARYDRLDHRALVALAEGGASVVEARAARLAARRRVPLRIYDYRASPDRAAGTEVVSSSRVRVATEPRTVRVALAGCGVVGSALATALRERRAAIEREQGVRLELVRALVRRTDRPRTVAAGLLTADVTAFLAARADVVVEALGGLEPASRIARETLARGARLVTANKALVAEAGAELAALAAASGGTFDFEAAVGGGIPVVRALRDALAQAPVRRVQGIVNGTCNYVLSRMEAGDSFAAAVAAAQRLGYAEADPTRDLDGTDAAEKLAILAWLAFGVPHHEVQVRRRGILADADALVATARGAGGRLRLLAECRLTADGVLADVAPAVVPAESGFGRTDGVENRIAIDLGWDRELALCGPGAGAEPTAAALLGDVLRACGPLPARRTRGALTLSASAPVPRTAAAPTLLAVEAS